MGVTVSIEAKIKELQLRKKKIDYVKYVKDLISNDQKCVDFKQVQQEIVSKMLPNLDDLIKELESDEAPIAKQSKIFTDEQHDTLVMIANRVINAPPKPVVAPTSAAPQSAYGQPAQNATPKAELSNSDKMNFAMGNRHLANKRVQVLNDQNTQIFGIVVGLDAPDVIVKTETGPTIHVPLEKVNLA